MSRLIKLGFAQILLLSLFGCKGEDEDDQFDPVIANGSFEMPADSERLPHWRLACRAQRTCDTDGLDLAQSWSLDEDAPADGAKSLMLRPGLIEWPDGTSEAMLSAAQNLHLPGAELKGRTVSVSLRIKHEGMDEPPQFLLVGYNEEVESEDPVLKESGVVGAYLGRADSAESEWKVYSGSFTATDPADKVSIILAALGQSGTVWFDDVRIDADPWAPGPGPSPKDVDIPLSSRSFLTGFAHEGPMDRSELGMEAQLDTAADSSDLFNVFFHVRWCRHPRAVFPCGADPEHKRYLEVARAAKERGLKLAVTLDFTHGGVEGIGDLNPLPDGSDPGPLSDSVVSNAYKEELLWLVDELDPDIVMVGVEVDIMYFKHPDWWDAYVAMEGEIYDAIKQRNASTHVTAYFTNLFAVSIVENEEDGTLIPVLNEDSATVWRMLLPKIDSIAYSTYPNVLLEGVPVEAYPAGYFSLARDIAPELPILIPEFGMAADGGLLYSERAQADALRQMLTEFAAADPVALVWYQMYDVPYYGFEQYQNRFRHIGMHDMSGTPRESFVIWQKIYALEN